LVKSAPRRGLSAVVKESMRSGATPQFVVSASEDTLDLPDIGLEL